MNDRLGRPNRDALCAISGTIRTSVAVWQALSWSDLGAETVRKTSLPEAGLIAGIRRSPRQAGSAARSKARLSQVSARTAKRNPAVAAPGRRSENSTISEPGGCFRMTPTMCRQCGPPFGHRVWAAGTRRSGTAVSACLPGSCFTRPATQRPVSTGVHSVPGIGAIGFWRKLTAGSGICAGSKRQRKPASGALTLGPSTPNFGGRGPVGGGGNFDPIESQTGTGNQEGVLLRDRGVGTAMKNRAQWGGKAVASRGCSFRTSRGCIASRSRASPRVSCSRK